MGNLGIYLLGATSDNGLKAKGAYLLQWTAIKWLREHRVCYYDLGGINRERNPGVYHFKSGLSGQDISRIPTLEACENLLSSLTMRVADLVRRRRESLNRLGMGGVNGVLSRQSRASSG